MARATRSRRQAEPVSSYVKFKYGNSRYTLSPEKSKVYDRWVEVETARASQILTAYWKQATPRVVKG